MKVFFLSIRGKIRENEDRIKESQDRIKALDEQIAKIPSDEEIRRTHEQIKKYSENILGKKEQLKKRAKEHYEFFVYSGSAFSLLPFQEKENLCS